VLQALQVLLVLQEAGQLGVVVGLEGSEPHECGPAPIPLQTRQNL